MRESPGSLSRLATTSRFSLRFHSMRKTSSSTNTFVWLAPLLGVGYVLSAGPSSAWTSAKGPLTDAIHQQAIDKVLSKSMSSADRAILDDEQSLVDKDQEPEQSAEHAMTGITKEGQDEAKERTVYIGLSEDLIHKMFASAIAARNASDNANAMKALGKAIHMLEDSTSPAHRGFQVWSSQFGIWEMAHHVLKERVYPDDRTADHYQSHLEGAVSYAYDIYMGTAPIPPHFFDPTSGNVFIPPNYLHTY
jgi:hypothetical protein